MTDHDHFAARSRARRRALQGLYQWYVNRQAPGDIVDQFIERQDFSNVDEKHFEQLLCGVVREQAALLERLAPVLDRPHTQLDLMEKIVLLIGVFELTRCPETPWRVVINECVDLSKRFGSEGGHAYVNGVLDKVAGELTREK